MPYRLVLFFLRFYVSLFVCFLCFEIEILFCFSFINSLISGMFHIQRLTLFNIHWKFFKQELRFFKKNPRSCLVPCWEKDDASLTHYKESWLPAKAAPELIISSFLCHLLCLVAVLAPLGLYINAKQQHWCTNAYILNWYSYWSLYCQISPRWLWQTDSVRNVKWLGDSLVQ